MRLIYANKSEPTLISKLIYFIIFQSCPLNNKLSILKYSTNAKFLPVGFSFFKPPFYCLLKTSGAGKWTLQFEADDSSTQVQERCQMPVRHLLILREQRQVTEPFVRAFRTQFQVPDAVIFIDIGVMILTLVMRTGSGNAGIIHVMAEAVSQEGAQSLRVCR